MRYDDLLYQKSEGKPRSASATAFASSAPGTCSASRARIAWRQSISATSVAECSPSVSGLWPSAQVACPNPIFIHELRQPGRWPLVNDHLHEGHFLPERFHWHSPPNVVPC